MRPGGALVGCDLVESAASRLTHRLDRSPHRMAPLEDRRRQLNALPYEAVDLTPGLGGMVTRCRALRSPEVGADTGPVGRALGGLCDDDLGRPATERTARRRSPASAGPSKQALDDLTNGRGWLDTSEPSARARPATARPGP